jgi:hypothetical protein
VPKKKKKPAVRFLPATDSRGRFPAGLGDALAVLFCFLVLAWLVTWGDWDFFPPPGKLEAFYDAQAQSLLEGRVDVAADAIGDEAFVRGGKSYGYFGPTPALARLPLQLLVPAMHGRWSRASMLIASVLGMLAVLLFFRRLERYLKLEGRHGLRALLRATAVVAVALGSCNLFLCAGSKAHEEAIIWGAALTLAHAVFLFCYLMEPRPRWLTLACAAAFLAFFARVSSGAGALLSLAIVDLAILLPFARWREYWGVSRVIGRPAAVAMSATLVAAAVLWAGLNYAKFGMFFASTPVQMHVQYDSGRLARLKGSLFSLDNLPLTAACYLVPGNIRFGARFPWAYLAAGRQDLERLFPKAHIDNIEAFSSLPSSVPGLLVAALCGTLLTFAVRGSELRVCRAPLAGAFGGCMVVFTIGFITYRYLGDMLPWLAVGSVIAMVRIPLVRSDGIRRGLAGLVLLLTAYGVWANFAFAMVQQRYYSYPIPPEKRMVFEDFSDAVSSGGLGALWTFGHHWRKYVEAGAFVTGSSNVGLTFVTGRRDEPVIGSRAVPARAEYVVIVPTGAPYEIAVRCASGESRPLQLLLNGQLAAVVCGQATGGYLQEHQLWFTAGVFPLLKGWNRLALVSDGPFPAVSMIRLIGVD